MKRLVILTLTFFTVLCVNIPVQAATLNVSISGLEALPGSNWSYQMNFDIGGIGTVTDVGFTRDGQYTWGVSNQVSIVNGNQVMGGSVLGVSGDVDPGNGALFSVAYDDGATLELAAGSILTGVVNAPIDLTQLSDPSITFMGGDNTLMLGPTAIPISTTVIPVPGAIWLLCSGLIGLAGIRRRYAN